jgi:hypothetical protein
MKQISFGLVLCIGILAVVELGTCVFFRMFQSRFTFYDPQRYLLTPEQHEKLITPPGLLSREENLVLGWDTLYPTPHGERPRPRAYGNSLIQTYGDSFTRCDDVEDDQTWQVYLSDKLQGDVLNFGVGGYGTDQAYLKYLGKYADIPTPIVFLGMITENINRIVSVFRPFYFPKTGIPTSKPRFVLVNGELKQIENPLKSTEGIAQLGDPRFIRQLGENDWWYNRDRHPVLEFPHTRILFNRRMWRELYYGKVYREITDMDPRPWENIWDREEARTLLFRILDAFVEDVHRRNAVPVIVLLPQRKEVEQAFRHGKPDDSIVQLAEYCREKDYLFFEGITPFVEHVADEQEISTLYCGHVSPKGNRILAEAMYRFLLRELPECISPGAAIEADGKPIPICGKQGDPMNTEPLLQP